MAEKNSTTGVYQLENGYWAYRFVVKVNGKNKAQKRVKDDNGQPFKTQRQAARARENALIKERNLHLMPQYPVIIRKTVAEVYEEYCEKGRCGKAYATIKKQDSLWRNHLKQRFGSRFVDELTVADVQDYLEELYYVDNRAFTYTESFLKMFYLILGQAYSRNYISVDFYNKLCVNKDTKIHMPKLKIDDDLDVVYFTADELEIIDEHFDGSNAQTAYMLGRYCGLRINECFGLTWDNIDFEEGTINIEKQMQYQDGLIKLVPLKTRNAKRKIYMCDKLKKYLLSLKNKTATWEDQYRLKRQQNQTIIQNTDGSPITSLKLVNSLPNGKMQTVNSMKYHSRLLKDMGIKFKFHYLRHTYGTMLAALNTPEYLLCNQMGHASVNVTHRYYIAISNKGIEVLLGNLNRL